MVTAGNNAVPSRAVQEQLAGRTPVRHKPLHRIRTVRLQQGVSMRTAARHTGTDIRQLRLQEQETTDLRISDLRKWQVALDVPLGELLVEPDSTLSQPVLDRARMVRLMKTIKAMEERADSAAIRRMAQTAGEQLIEVMPELKQVSPWHEYGQRRSLEEYGRIAERPVSEDLLRCAFGPD